MNIWTNERMDSQQRPQKDNGNRDEHSKNEWMHALGEAFYKD